MEIKYLQDDPRAMSSLTHGSGSIYFFDQSIPETELDTVVDFASYCNLIRKSMCCSADGVKEGSLSIVKSTTFGQSPDLFLCPYLPHNFSASLNANALNVRDQVKQAYSSARIKTTHDPLLVSACAHNHYMYPEFLVPEGSPLYREAGNLHTISHASTRFRLGASLWLLPEGYTGVTVLAYQSYYKLYTDNILECRISDVSTDPTWSDTTRSVTAGLWTKFDGTFSLGALPETSGPVLMSALIKPAPKPSITEEQKTIYSHLATNQKGASVPLRATWAIVLDAVVGDTIIFRKLLSSKSEIHGADSESGLLSGVNAVVYTQQGSVSGVEVHAGPEVPKTPMGNARRSVPAVKNVSYLFKMPEVGLTYYVPDESIQIGREAVYIRSSNAKDSAQRSSPQAFEYETVVDNKVLVSGAINIQEEGLTLDTFLAKYDHLICLEENPALIPRVVISLGKVGSGADLEIRESQVRKGQVLVPFSFDVVL